MAGAVIENLSNRKLFVILSVLLFAQILFFIIGAVFSPLPSTSMEFLMSRCKDKNAGRTKDWFYIRPKVFFRNCYYKFLQNCDMIQKLEEYTPISTDMRDIVFVAQMPHAKNGVALQYSPWFQFLIGFLEVEIEYNPVVKLEEKATLELEIRMAFRTADDPVDKWTEFIGTTIQRTLECHIDKNKRQRGYIYNCSIIDLFELGSNNYPFYLLNIRLPVNATKCQQNKNAPNCGIGSIHELRLIAVHQNGGFTTIWLWLKTIVTPLIMLTTWWYNKRVQALNRKKFLIEKAILALGLAMIVLDFPIEWFSLWFRIPILMLVGDIKQGLFYTILFSFWLIFAGEHLIDDTTRNNLKNYWQNLSLVGTASLLLLGYDLAGRGRQLIDPFFSIWSTSNGTMFAKFAIYFAAFLIITYFIFLCFKICLVWNSIKRKRSAQLYLLSENRRLKVEAIIYRFKFLMILTLVCAFSTIVSYAMQQYDEGQFPDDDYLADESGNPTWSSALFTHSASAFFTGTFGMWNIYVFLLLSMYAPSHKYYNGAQILENENEDLMDPNSTATESTQMTSFLKPATD